MKLPDPARAVGAAITAVAVALCAAAAVCTLYSAYSAFVSGKFILTDYGKYVNMVWNTGHGRPFLMLMDFSYLQTHLSFTLALLGPLFLVWDHPFALSAAQWMIGVGGLLVLWRTAVRKAIPAPLTAALLLFFAGNSFTQSVLLSEFHGVALYLLLIPWLHQCLCFRKGSAWLPLLLLMGVREEAAFLVVPMLLYHAIRDRWRMGYVWAGVAIAYGVLACTCLFRLLSGTDLAERRDGIKFYRVRHGFAAYPLLARLRPLGRLFLPALPFLHGGWVAVIVYPAAAVLVSFLSPYPVQHTMSFQYPAAALACLAPGILEAMCGVVRTRVGRGPWAWNVLAAALVALTLADHALHGFTFFGGRYRSEYGHPHVTGAAVFRAAKHIPREGLLLCHQRIAGYCANRADLVSWRLFDAQRHRPDVVFFRMRELQQGAVDALLAYLHGGEFGVRFFDGGNVVMVRGEDTSANALVLRTLEESSRTLLFAFMPRDGGSERLVDGCYIARYWPGSDRPGVAIARSRAVQLPAGRYRARLRYRREGGEDPGAAGGKLLLLVDGQEVQAIDLASASGTPTGDGFVTVQLPLELSVPSSIEPRVHGGTARLWLDRIVFDHEAWKGKLDAMERGP